MLQRWPVCEDVVGFPVSGRLSSSWLHNDLTPEPWWPLYVSLFKQEKGMPYREIRKEEGTRGGGGEGEEGRGGVGREDPGWSRWLFPEGTTDCASTHSRSDFSFSQED